MMNRGMAVIAVFLVSGLVQSALADDWTVSQGQWYLSPMVGMNFEDKGRDSDPGIAASLGVGRKMTESLSLEVSAFGGKNPGYNEFRPVGLGIDLLLNLGDLGIVTPYLQVGTGYMKADYLEGPIINRELNYDTAIGTVGFGVVAPLGNAAARLRADVRYRYDFKDPQFGDVLTMVGLYFPLGDTGPRPVKSRQMPDADGDGVANEEDLCPDTPVNTDVDVFGCELDRDRDGIPDITDDCPDTPKGMRVNSRGCSRFVESDEDQDGVADRDDRCPGTPRQVEVDSNGCKVEEDSDGDGVPDSLDSCPNTPANVRIDIRGCEIRGAIRLPGVRFELSSDTLISTSTAKLDEAAATLLANPDLRVEAAGYTDTSGPAELNLDLSQRRAESVRRYLISRGVNPSNITARGYGEANPIADNSIRSGRQQNRRVELRILN